METANIINLIVIVMTDEQKEEEKDAIREGKILMTKQVRPQRRLFGGKVLWKETAFPHWRATDSR